MNDGRLDVLQDLSIPDLLQHPPGRVAGSRADRAALRVDELYFFRVRARAHRPGGGLEDTYRRLRQLGLLPGDGA